MSPTWIVCILKPDCPIAAALQRGYPRPDAKAEAAKYCFGYSFAGGLMFLLSRALTFLVKEEFFAKFRL